MLERVQKIIASSGLCSRRKAEELIEDGKVKVNDVIITIGDKADIQKDKITVNGQRIEKEPFVYYMLHKPKNYVTTSFDPHARHMVTELVPKKPRVFSVGRLDIDATGLLILTNDGDFANRIMHPRYHAEKTYIAVLKSPFNAKDCIKAKKGVLVDNTLVKANIIPLDKITVAITIHVGIHKVVKRVFKELGYYVKTLHRTHIGNLALDMPEGEYRPITKEEKKQLTQTAQITKETFLQ